MIEAVVWDVGRVLIEWHPEGHYDNVIGPDRRRELFAATDLHEMNRAIDMGAHSAEVVAAHAEKHPDWADEIQRWHDDWLTMCSPRIPQSAVLLQALKDKGVPVFALSNFGWNTFEIAREAYPFLNLFDVEFVSGRLGMMKPDPAIYERLETDTGIAPDRLIFTDDTLVNIEAAAARGWHTHHFLGPEGWRDRLLAEGLLTEDDLPA
jgi:2-haloacid dehalogenase